MGPGSQSSERKTSFPRAPGLGKHSGITHKPRQQQRPARSVALGVASCGPDCFSKSVAQATAALSLPNLERWLVGPHSGILHLCEPPQLWVFCITPWVMRPCCLPDSLLLCFLLTQLSARRRPGFLRHRPCPHPLVHQQDTSVRWLCPLPPSSDQPYAACFPGSAEPSEPVEGPVFSAFWLISEGTGHLAGL